MMPSLRSTLAPLPEKFSSRLISMYQGDLQRGVDGKWHNLDPVVKISPSQGMWIYNLCRAKMPTPRTLEVGMAYGYSTIYFLAALSQNGGGCHTAIDPFQDAWGRVGLAHANALSSPGVFRFFSDRSDRVATDLARSGETFEVIFIDGNHRFDDVLVDFYLYAPLCAIGGYIIFDDSWMSSIQTVASYIRANRMDFKEISTREQNIFVFQKVSHDSRSWKNFRKFPVSADSD